MHKRRKPLERRARCAKRRSAQTAQPLERRARCAKRRELPNSANCQTAQTAQRRKLPKSARCQTTTTAPTSNGANCRRAQVPKSATADGGSRRARTRTDTASRRYAGFPSAVRAVGQFAPYGNSRRWAVRDPRQYAPLCAPARAVSAVCAVRQFAPAPRAEGVLVPSVLRLAWPPCRSRSGGGERSSESRLEESPVA